MKTCGRSVRCTFGSGASKPRPPSPLLSGYSFPVVYRFGAQELEIIKGHLDRSGRQFRFCSAVATLKNVGELVGNGCRMFHYAGHGTENSLSFESDRHCGIMEPVEVRWCEIMNHFFLHSFVICLRCCDLV